jgi:bifunctional UDP-N-acetylglucosamine pyrophosphorylase/glucosamine-1-phosphate N-acetyltransferase
MTSVIILAAGKGTRMRSKIPKVLHPILGKPLLSYGIEAAIASGADELVVVASREVMKSAASWTFKTPGAFTLQDPPLGTADAVKRGMAALDKPSDVILILPGDVPLITPETLKTLMARFKESQSDLTILGEEVPDPYGYGRIITDAAGEILRIVEEKDATQEQKANHFINSGIMVVRRTPLAEMIAAVETNNIQREFYLTDLAALFREKKLKISAFKGTNPVEILGINNRRQLHEARKVLLKRMVEKWQREGVDFLFPETVYIENNVTIGGDSMIGQGVVLKGRTVIGEACRIHAGAVIEDAILDDEVTVKPYSVIEESRVRTQAIIGPFAHIRPGSDIGPEAKVGNFVEIKKSKLSPGVKASHLSYLGDCEIGDNTNIGAGTITCNYDGMQKHKTVIGKDVFVGSNTAFVAPVSVGDGVLIAAGSVITKEVPPGAMGVARARQKNFFRRRKKRGAE